MSIYREIYPPVETVLEMEPQELAPIILKHLSQSGSQINRYNFTNGNSPDFIEWAGSSREAAMERLMVGWMWLEKELFVAPKPGLQDDWAFITPRGKKILGSQDFETYKQLSLLPSEGLDPILVQKAKQSFIRGDYETAIFQAFKEVEVRVKEKAGYGAERSDEYMGVKLMRKAFSPAGGPLTDSTASGGEKTARMELFAGAIGSYKNPSSHRYVNFNDPGEAADIIHLANQLLRTLEK
jgi:uncharacterized protein (TIGR02391 family)